MNRGAFGPALICASQLEAQGCVTTEPNNGVLPYSSRTLWAIGGPCIWMRIGDGRCSAAPAVVRTAEPYSAPHRASTKYVVPGERVPLPEASTTVSRHATPPASENWRTRFRQAASVATEIVQLTFASSPSRP